MSLPDIIEYHRTVFAEFVAPTVWLFLWRVAAMQDQALALIKELGFAVKTDIVWVKTRKTEGPTQRAPGLRAF